MKSPKPAKNKRQTNHQSGRPGIHYPKNTRTHPDRVKEQAREKLVKFSRATRNSWHSPQKSTQKIVHRHTIEFSKNTSTPSTTGHSRPLQAARWKLKPQPATKSNSAQPEDELPANYPTPPAPSGDRQPVSLAPVTLHTSFARDKMPGHYPFRRQMTRHAGRRKAKTPPPHAKWDGGANRNGLRAARQRLTRTPAKFFLPRRRTSHLPCRRSESAGTQASSVMRSLFA